MEPKIKESFEGCFMDVTNWIAADCPKGEWPAVTASMRVVTEYMYKSPSLRPREKAYAMILYEQSLKENPDFEFIHRSWDLMMGL